MDELGYNSNMKRLTKEKVTKEEKEVIYDWLDYYECQKIRACFYGYVIDESYLNKAKTLDGMFEKYDSFLDKSEPIYRGLAFNKNNKVKVGAYKKFVSYLLNAFKNNELITIDRAPSSFSRNKKVAFNEFARVKDDDYNSIVFELVERKNSELYIKEFAGKFAYQDEIVVKSHKSLYQIIDIKENESFVIIKIKEVQDE